MYSSVTKFALERGFQPESFRAAQTGKKASREGITSLAAKLWPPGKLPEHGKMGEQLVKLVFNRLRNR